VCFCTGDVVKSIDEVEVTCRCSASSARQVSLVPVTKQNVPNRATCEEAGGSLSRA